MPPKRKAAAKTTTDEAPPTKVANTAKGKKDSTSKKEPTKAALAKAAAAAAASAPREAPLVSRQRCHVLLPRHKLSLSFPMHRPRMVWRMDWERTAGWLERVIFCPFVRSFAFTPPFLSLSLSFSASTPHHATLIPSFTHTHSHSIQTPHPTFNTTHSFPASFIPPFYHGQQKQHLQKRHQHQI